MALLKSTAALLGLTFAALVVLSSAAPLGVNLERLRRQATTSGTPSLRNVAAGLDVLYRLSVQELMTNLSIDTSTTAAVDIAKEAEFGTAMDITCDLYSAKHELIPSISNSSNVTFVVKKLNEANLIDSCTWLKQVVTGKSGSLDCTQEENVGRVCKRWSSIQQFNTTITKVGGLLESLNATPTGCRDWAMQFSTDPASLNQLCPQ